MKTASNLKRNVVFRAVGFNTSEPKPYFINDCCFGDDLARWLLESLKANGVPVEAEPGQEDFGWFIRFSIGGVDHQMTISYRPATEGEQGDWICSIERKTGLLGSIIGDSKRALPEAPVAIHAALSQPPCSDVRWYNDEDFKREQNPSAQP